MNIPKGYQLHVTTWENDADHYKTQVLSGLTKEDVHFYVNLAKRFKSKYSGDSGPCLGNSGNTDEDLEQAIKNSLLEAPPSDEVREHVKKVLEGEDYADFLADKILGYTDGYDDEHNFCRVFESFKVYYFPEDVLEVTEEFK